MTFSFVDITTVAMSSIPSNADYIDFSLGYIPTIPSGHLDMQGKSAINRLHNLPLLGYITTIPSGHLNMQGKSDIT